MLQIVPDFRGEDVSHDVIATLIRDRKPGHMLPAGLYNRRDVFEADLDMIFHRHWIAVAVEADVPEPGDVYAVDIGRSSILIVRDEDEGIRAFHNVCSHRAARLVPAGHSIVGKLVCPYHQWAYDLTGELFSAPHMGVDFDMGLHHLKPVAVRNIGGLVYVCLSQDPPQDIETLAALMSERLEPYELKDAKVAFETDIVEKGNWKLVIENNRECYHCAANHPELCLSLFAADFGFDAVDLSPTERAEADALDAAYVRARALWDGAGLDHSAVEHWQGQATNFRTERLLIAGTGESQTPDSRAASRVPLGRMGNSGCGNIHLWGINSWNHVMADHAVVINIFPLSPGETLVRTKWLVHKDAVEGVDYDLDHLTSVWIATNQQDADLVAMSQEGVRSAGYTPGPYSVHTERLVDDWTTWYCERMTHHGYGG
ncbi:aromatic ring-hydroxylating oxygenase subunit alpha [Acuticoccus mangrovi]|uniref:Aromatic ring-hydroxylating dioxygenase subunit alpha n=1 Tax=Acuticoccus mangrovi TaxID=2796142 RepID=A0A934MG06_9HYPH|nr:aromatic ring-hydroxylating dioxygenase subunit alpha [Acuticoccus mangrovi]MBJ3775480.1 aromatic ring-hydroxylating dioxygenase subunit alpha [Acuticoccus mangrovi]